MIISQERFAALLNNLKNRISKMFPISGERNTIAVTNLKWKNTGSDIYGDPELHKKYKTTGRTLASRLLGDVSIVDTKTGKVLDRQTSHPILSVPHLTSKQSFIVGGKEVQIVNQIRLKPGTYTRYTADNNVETFINTAGGGYRIQFDRVRQIFRIRVGQSTYVYLYPILKALDVNDVDLRKIWGDEILQENRKYDRPAELAKLYKKMRPYAEEPENPEELAEAVNSFFASKPLDPNITKLTLGTKYTRIEPKVLVASSEKALKLARGEVKADDTENLAYKSLHSVDDFVFEKLEQNIPMAERAMKYQIDRRPSVVDVLPPSLFTKPIQRFFTTSEFSRYSDQNNPIDMVGVQSLVTSMGEGGISSIHAVSDRLRALHPSHLGIFDPIQTPESNKIGINAHLTLGAKKIGNEIGLTVINARTGQRETKKAFDIQDKVLAFYDEFDHTQTPPKAKKASVKARFDGELKMMPASKVDYILDNPSKLFGFAANAVPFVHTNSPNRVLMASHHISQAVPLADPDVPLVQSKFGARGYETAVGERIVPQAPVDGVVKRVTAKKITIRGNDGQTYTVPLHDHYPLNSNAFLNEKAIVATGQKVKKGQPVADSDFTRGGSLAMGKTMRVGFLPYKGHNFEDGIVVSETAAKKLTSVHKHELSLNLDATISVGLPVFLAHFPAEAEGVDRSKYGGTGVVKTGAVLTMGDVAIPAVRKIKVHEEFSYASLHRSLRNQWQDVSVRWDNEYPAEVMNVVKTRKFITVYVKTSEALEVGDKLSNRHGGKGIVTMILPDKEMYQGEDSKPMDVLFNPSGVLGRANPGTYLESAAGKIAEKTGKIYLVNNFGGKDAKTELQNELASHGINRNSAERLYDPTTNKHHADVMTGNLHFVKLRHQVSKKLSARGHTTYTHDESPAREPHASPMAIGMMEMYSLLSSGGTAFLRDVATIKSQKNDEFWRAIQLGMPTPPPKSPFVVDKFMAYMKGAGINVKQDGKKLKALPLTDADILDQSNGAITSPGVVRANDLAPEPKGLFDRGLTGGFDGCFFGAMQVLTSEGWVAIKDIVENRMMVLVACHTENGRIVWRRVTQFWRHLRREPLLRMEFSLGGAVNGFIRRSIATTLLVTPNHSIAVAPHQYERADRMDGRSVVVPSHELSGLQEQIVLGGLLGDAHITKDKNPLFQMAQAVNQEAWLRWKAAILEGWVDGVSYVQPKNRQRRIVARSFRHIVWADLRQEWYPDGVKGLPQKCLDRIDARGLAVWFGDDGTGIVHHGSPVLGLCTHNFAKADVERLRGMLRDRFGLDSYIPTRAKKYLGRDMGYAIYFNTANSDRFMRLIAPWVTADIVRKFKVSAWGNRCDCGRLMKKRLRFCNRCLLDEVACYSHRRDFDANSRFESTTVRKRFGSWSRGRRLAADGVEFPEEIIDVPAFGSRLSDREGAVTVLRRVFVRVKEETRRPFSHPTWVYDIGVGGEHNYVVQGICVSNSYWNHLSLEGPIANPLMDQAIIGVLSRPGKPFKRSEFNGLINGTLWVTPDGELTHEHTKENVSGGEGLKRLLAKIDVSADLRALQRQVGGLKGDRRDVAVKKMRYLRALKAVNLTPVQAYINTKVPVVPAKMRPIYPNPDGTLNVADPVHGYREVLMVNNQIKDLKVLGVDNRNLAPLRAQLYGAVRGLVGLQEPLTRSKNFKGFLATIKGQQNKYGLFQGRVLKRRQDLSGRSTIIPDPKLGLDEVKLPEEMAFTIYKPFIVQRMGMLGYAPLKARELIEKRDPIARAALEAVIKDRPVILNRAPSLHKFSLLSFKPMLAKGKAIEINPLVVKGFNADFDGDAMQVHVPVSEDARVEAMTTLLPSNNLFSPRDSSLMHSPSMEMILGIYLMTTPKGKAVRVGSENAASQMYRAGKIKVNQAVMVHGNKICPGQIIFNNAFPAGAKPGNIPVDKSKLMKLLHDLARKKPAVAGQVISKVKDLGNKYVTEIGWSFDLGDLSFPKDVRNKILAKAKRRAKTVGFAKAYSAAAAEMEKAVRAKVDNRAVIGGPLSGAFGKANMITQMVASPVAVIDHEGKVTEVPIERSFSEGMDMGSFWALIPGARKGLMDRTLSTADTGAFGKALIAATVDTTISMRDCGTRLGLEMGITDPEALDRIVASGAYRGKTTDPQLIRNLKARGVKKIKVRSPLRCQATRGVCALCFGSLENGQLPSVGYHVGTLAGQTISEPATQLTMSTFHTGGALGGTSLGYPRLKQILEMPTNVKGRAILALQPGKIDSIETSAAGGWNVSVDGMRHFVPKEVGLGVKKRQKVFAGQMLSAGGAVKPQDLLAATNDIQAVQTQMITDMSKVFTDAGVRVKRKIFETAIHPLTTRAQVDDSGDADVEFGVHRSDVMSVNNIEDMNKKLKRKRKQLIEFTPTLLSIRKAPQYANDFIGQLVAERPHQTLKAAPGLGAVSDIGPSGHPIATYAFGKYFNTQVKDNLSKTALTHEIDLIMTTMVDPEEVVPSEFDDDVSSALEKLASQLEE